MSKKNGCYVNIDGDVLGYVYHGVKGDMSNLREKLDLYLEGYKGYGISDLLFTVFCQNSIVPSKTVDWLYDNYDKTEEDGKPVNYKGETHVRACYMAYNEMKDPIGYMIEESKKAGFNTWLSYRMNDCHWSHAETAPGRADQLYYHAKYNNGFIGDHVAGRYFGECFDYTSEHIRRVMLEYIKETVYRYHPYGIELDFLREPFCFDYEKTPDACRIMTEFISDIKKMLAEYARSYERAPVKILARVVPHIEDNRIFGLDTEEWIKRGLVDVIVPSSRWNSTDSDMPISDWVALAEGTNVEISAGLEFYLWLPIKVNDETVRGLASQYFDSGAERIYLYNYYREAVALPDMTEWSKAHPDFRLSNENGDDTDDAHIWNTEKLAAIDFDKTKIWAACENPEAARNGARRHVLTYLENCLVPRGGKYFDPLPIKVEGTAQFKKLTGKLLGEEALLYLGVKQGVKAPRVTVDGNEATLLGATDDAYFANPETDGSIPERFNGLDYYAYKPTVDEEDYRKLTFEGDASIEYLEFKVNA